MLCHHFMVFGPAGAAGGVVVFEDRVVASSGVGDGDVWAKWAIV